MTVYYKMRQILIQNTTAVLLQNATEVYYKLWQYNDECSEDVKGECSFAKYTLRNYSEESLKKFSGLKWCIFQETFRRNHWPKFLKKKSVFMQCYIIIPSHVQNHWLRDYWELWYVHFVWKELEEKDC